MFTEENLIQLFNQYVVPWSVKILVALIIFFVGQLVVKIVSRIIGKLLTHTKLDSILVGFVQSLVRALLMIIVIIAVLDQLGVNTNSVIAILGAAGLAVGLALQGSLQNFAAGFLLLIFRPFKSGDWIEAAGVSGQVVTIGIFTTTLLTGDNKQVIIPNGDIYGGNIINYSSMGTRRIDLIIGVSYSDDMKKVRDTIAEVIKAESRILAEPETLIAVGELGGSSVNFFVRPWVKTNDYWSVKFALIESIKQEFDANDISIPFPQMDVHLNKIAKE